ncbi:hypothetical protein H4S02_003474 [Coemansia sp. RSA 2611]|nr:hypothetical protein IWW51_004460 [Coemansia sp. RSA 2702]KAJ2387212.1 hypothetical protein H4S02_003474 [Coemansia sp. RSA 2611]
MDALPPYPLHDAREPSIDKKPSYKHERHGALITSTLCYSIDLTESIPQASMLPYPIPSDMEKRQILQLQNYKQVLCLGMLCATVCWISLTTTFVLLIVRETTFSAHANDSYVFKYTVALVALFTAWGVSAVVCLWRYNRFKFSINAGLASAEWITVGTPSIRTSMDTAISHL